MCTSNVYTKATLVADNILTIANSSLVFYGLFNPRSLKERTSLPQFFFGLKSERLDQLPKVLAQLFPDNEYMFWQ